MTNDETTVKPWTIEVKYNAQDDKGKSFRATTAFWVEAIDIPSAYKVAEESFKGRPDVVFGFILPGHHQMLPGFRHGK